MVDYFCEDGQTNEVIGIDNNLRADFFGQEGDTNKVRQRLWERHRNFHCHAIDIRSASVGSILWEFKPDLVVHAAGQPSHDLAAQRPLDDWSVNASATLGLLEATRKAAPKAVFVYMSTNKVYGDHPNRICAQFIETDTRYSANEAISETMSIDQCQHSLFGVSKAAADLAVQEYGRYFGMNTCCLRCGCLTGPDHAGVELHGFLNYLVKCNVTGTPYRVYGYKGKQVRDNLHAHDVARFVHAFLDDPRCGEVYNLGGGEANSCSILEAGKMAEALSGKPMQFEFLEEPRKGDHICYVSDLRKARKHYPGWSVTIPLTTIIKQIHEHYTRTP